MCHFFRSVLSTAALVFLLLSFPRPNHDLRRNSNNESSKTSAVAMENNNGGAKGSTIFEDLSTLEDIWRLLKDLVPNRGTRGYVPPGGAIVADFELVVRDMMVAGTHPERGDTGGHRSAHARTCDEIDLRGLNGKYRIGTFVDGDTKRSYCVLATTSISYPWGTVVVDLDAATTKNLSFDCPHPRFDAETGEQGIRLLKGTTAGSWIVAGSHRMANNDSPGTCQPEHSYRPSDAAHSDDNCFLAAVAAVKFYYESVVRQDYTSVQLHGMGTKSCGSVDTFFSHGSCRDGPASKPEKIDVLSEIASAQPLDDGLHASANSDGSGCRLCASTNVQGRLINGVPRSELCERPASSHNGRFVHIEQKREYRRERKARFWNDVFGEAYPRFLDLAGNTPVPATERHATGGGGGEENHNDCLEAVPWIPIGFHSDL